MNNAPERTHSSEEQKADLSARGIARREAMLSELQDAMRSRRRIRATVRSGGAAALALAAALGLFWAGRGTPARPGIEVAGNEGGDAIETRRTDEATALGELSRFESPSTIRVVTTIVDTDHLTGSLVMVVTAGPSRIQRVDDGELVSALRERGVDVGVAHVAGRSRLIRPTATP